jgi:hypothetical protein
MTSLKRRLLPDIIGSILVSLLFLVLLVIMGITTSCSGTVVREADVYTAEIDFIEQATQEQVEGAKALIGDTCECREIAGVTAFETEECHALAETVVVVEARMGYHLAFMRYLGGLDEERPPETPPEVPEATTLCPKASGLDIPVRGDSEADGGA